jgi:hypothetical protein
MKVNQIIRQARRSRAIYRASPKYTINRDYDVPGKRMGFIC